jgi:uncharacterized membrane protein YhaH (DUF805 family)
VIWATSGALMVFNPPPPEPRRAQSLPLIGCIVLVGGIWIAVQAMRAHDARDSGQPPRHAATTSRRQQARFWLAVLIGLPASGAMLWWGLSSRSLSLVGLATACLSPTVLSLAAWIRYPGLR